MEAAKTMTEPAPIEPVPSQPVERLFPFVLKSHALLVGRDTLRANKSKLHFVLITTDIADVSREEVLENFMHYPVVQHCYGGRSWKLFFNCKRLARLRWLMAKSTLAQTIYAELKAYRINKHFIPPKRQRPESPPVAPTGNKAEKPFPSRRPTHR